MAELSKLDFEGKFNNSNTGLFKNNTNRDIGADDIRAEVEDLADSVPFTLDDSYRWAFPKADTTGTNTYAVTLSPAITAYTNGMKIHVKIKTASTGASTLNANTVGAKKIFLDPTTQADTGDLVDEQEYIMSYDAALDSAAGGWLIIGGGGSGGAVDSVNGATGVVVLDAGDIGVTPVGGIAATDVQAALAELDSEKATTGSVSTVATDLSNHIADTTDAHDASAISFTPAGTIAATDVQAAIEELDGDFSAKVDEETFATLTFASPTVWACDSRQMPLAKVTATGDFTINMTNVKSGSQGILKVTANTASAFTLTFDTDFTNVEATTNDSLLTYTFPADNGQFYLLNFVCDGTILHWTILDVQSENPIPFAQIGRAAAQSISNNDSTVFVTMDTETHDNSNIWAVSPNPTRFTIPGSGNKVATISIRAQWAANATGVRRNIPYLNGVTTGDIAQTTGISGVAVIHNSTHQVACAGGDYIEILCYQNSGSSLSLDATGVRIQIHDR